MWQLLFAAAVAGSTGFVAKHLFNPSADHTATAVAEQTEKCGDHFKQGEDSIDNFEAKVSISPTFGGSNESGYESNCEKQDGIFRFSSHDSNGKVRNSRKKSGITCRGSEKRVAKKEVVRRSGGGVEVSGRRFSVCLKRRKMAKNVAGKYGSCSSKGSSLFGCGLGVGIMYMMSAGKAEISKLNASMDETAKVVQELKSELRRRKSSHKLQVLRSANEVPATSKNISSDHAQLELNKASSGDGDININVSGPPIIDDGEYASSVLTEEEGPELLDQLEAELEFELEKLPWCTKEVSCNNGTGKNMGEVSAKGFCEPEGQCSVSNQCHGVLPSELDQKLCHLLIEQQENQIVELESELHLAQSKLQEKEAELQALKDCVTRLTEFSLSSVSEDEIEEQECPGEWDYNIKMGSERRSSMVGVKRSIDP